MYVFNSVVLSCWINSSMCSATSIKRFMKTVRHQTVVIMVVFGIGFSLDIAREVHMERLFAYPKFRSDDL